MTVLKSIVLLLALANVGYFLWSRGIRSSAAVPNAVLPNTLRLASEAPPGAGSDASADGAAAAAAGLPGDVKRCVSVGPFRDVSEAAHAASTLRSGGYDPRQRVIDSEVYAGVWVYLPVTSTHAVTEQMLAKLKAAGIEDALEMPGPIDGSVISLGLFGEPKRAQARVAQAQALGLNPFMTDRKRSGNAYWIDIDLKPTDGPLKAADLQGEAGRIQRLEVKACPVDGAEQP